MKKKITVTQAQGRRLSLGPLRLTYAHVFEPWVAEGTDPAQAKYQTAMLIPKSETKAIAAINACVEAAITEGIPKVWKGTRPKKIDTPLRDGDEKENAGAEYENAMWLNAKSGRKPQVVDRNFTPLTDPESVYSGCWALVNIEFYAYEKNGNRGVGVALNSIMKLYDDDQLGGGSMSAHQAFGGIDLSQFSGDDEEEDY